MKWGEAAVLLVVANYADSRTDDLARALGRTVRAVYQLANAMGLRKSSAYLATENAGRIQRGKSHPAMRASQFQPGLTPWNKGAHYVAGGRSAETRFKLGAQTQTWRPIGTYAVDTGGLLKLKVTDLRDPPRKDWIYVHRQVWEATHGPISGGGIVRFKPGRKTADPALIVADALELITRAENLQRNSVHRLPKEVALLVQLRGAINRQINKRARNEDDQRPA